MAGICEMQTLKFVPPRLIPFSATAEHFLHKRTHQACARLISSERYLNKMLARAIQTPKPEFRVPLAYALSALGPKLDFTIHANSINKILRGWVQGTGKIVRVDNWFLGAHDWSKVLINAEDDSIVQEARMLIDANFRFAEIESYANYRQRLEAGDPTWRNIGRLDSVEKIESYFVRFKALYDSIEKHGLLSTEELADQASGHGESLPQRRIGIAIGADGTQYRLPGGQHRFAIGLILGCQIPVQLRLIHVNRLKVLADREQTLPTALISDEVQQLAATGRVGGGGG